MFRHEQISWVVIGHAQTGDDRCGNELGGVCASFEAFRGPSQLFRHRLVCSATCRVWLPAPPAARNAFAEEPETAIVAIGGIPGKAYVPTGWEVWAPFHPVYASGRYEEVIDRGRELIEATGYPEPLFNLACCESPVGRTADAIRLLRLALDRTQRYRERLRSLAATDTDFDPIRDEPKFQQLIDPTPQS